MSNNRVRIIWPKTGIGLHQSNYLLKQLSSLKTWPTLIIFSLKGLSQPSLCNFLLGGIQLRWTYYFRVSPNDFHNGDWTVTPAYTPPLPGPKYRHDCTSGPARYFDLYFNSFFCGDRVAVTHGHWPPYSRSPRACALLLLISILVLYDPINFNLEVFCWRALISLSVDALLPVPVVIVAGTSFSPLLVGFLSIDKKKTGSIHIDW